VIVRASDLALRDLLCQPGQVLPPDEPRNLLRFRGRVDVIEIEDDRVGLAAINAGMSHQVVVREELARAPIAHAPLACLPQVCGPV